jgi:hypothetical protein
MPLKGSTTGGSWACSKRKTDRRRVVHPRSAGAVDSLRSGPPGIRRHHCASSVLLCGIDILLAQHTATGAAEKILSSGQGAALSSPGISEK